MSVLEILVTFGRAEIRHRWRHAPPFKGLIHLLALLGREQGVELGHGFGLDRQELPRKVAHGGGELIDLGGRRIAAGGFTQRLTRLIQAVFDGLARLIGGRKNVESLLFLSVRQREAVCQVIDAALWPKRRASPVERPAALGGQQAQS